MLAAAEEHDVWLLTRMNNVDSIRRAISHHALRTRIRIEGFDFAPTLLRLKKTLRWAGTQLYYDLWQRRASEVALALDRLHDFDVLHHATFASNWTRIGVASVPKPLVVGPVGGSASTPWKLWPVLGLRGVPGEILRRAARPGLARITGAERAISSASVVLIQNQKGTRGLPEADRVKVLPNGLIGALTGIEMPEDLTPSTEVVFAGRLIGWKGPVLAIEAMRFVDDPTLQLHVFGSGAELVRLKRRVSRLRLASRVIFHGSVSRERVLHALAGARALVHPALHDESPITVAEALALGTPVVCLDLAGPPLLTSYWPDVPGRVVRPSTPGRTARDIADALDAVAGARVRPDFSPGRAYVEGLLESYRLAVRNGRAP
jgi:glycosyltransferase involved in cell wall biosynthesis